MNLLYHHRTKSRDGQAVHIRELIAALRRGGHQVREWALSPGEQGAMGSEGGLLGKLAAAAPRVGYELAEHAYGPLVASRLVSVGRQAGAEVLYERHALNNSAGVRAAARLGIPLLLEVNSPLSRERASYEKLVLRRWAAACERRVLAAADRVLVVTRVLADILLADGLPAERIEVLPNGADLSRYPLVSPPEHEQLVVGFTGFFRPWHGLDVLVEALADGSLPEGTRLLLVGDGPSRADLEAQAARLEVSARLTITGPVERECIPDLVSGMDVCLQPAATPWASPLKLFEYMAAGRAVVAPDQANLREVLTHERDALLFAPRDRAAMAAAVLRLAGDPPLRAELGAAARGRLEAGCFTWEHNAERVVDIAHDCRAAGAFA